MQSNRELINALRSAPATWMDAAIVVAFESRFEFVTEDHPDPAARLSALQAKGGLPIGLAGVQWETHAGQDFMAEVFEEFENQAWAHRYMDMLRGIVRRHSLSK